MPSVSSTAATLRFFGDDLLPDEITSLLGRAPTESKTKGEPWQSKTRTIIAKTGWWRLCADDCSPGALDAQIESLLGGLNHDLDVCSDLTERFDADVFCGLFMKDGNEGISLAPQTLVMLGARNLILGLDIYGEQRDED
jgi:hypothetical protein